MSDLLTELQEAHRESPSWRLFGLCHLAAARIAALEAHLAERVKVKALEWGELRPTEDNYLATDAYTSIGHYIATHSGWFLVGQSGWNKAVSLSETKAAAQADYERRILTALEATPPAPEVTEAMVDAAERTMAAHYERPLKAWELTALHEALKAAMEAGR